MKVKNLIIVFLIFSISISVSFAKDCGGKIECECGDIVSSNYILKSNLLCDSNGLELKRLVKLDCNKNKIQGKNNGIGIKINGIDSAKIKNCEILNFTTGIEQKSVQIPNLRLDPNVNIISNNIIRNNKIGIVNINAERITIVNNTFKDNLDFAITLNSDSFGNIYSNIFDNNNLSYPNSKGKKYCVNGISNIYLNSAIGPSCDCEIPSSSILYDSNVKFCKGEYNIGLKIGSNSNINCNGAIFNGGGLGVGFLLEFAPNTIISNCIIRNYDTGILYTHKQKNYWASERGELYNNTIYDVNRGLSFNYLSRAEILVNNTIIARDFTISNNIDYSTDARNNYWGTNNKSEIQSKFLNSDLITFEPFINKTFEDDIFLDVDSLKIEESGISFEISKSNINSYNNFSYEVIVFRDGKVISDKILNLNLTSTKTNIFYEFNFNEGDEVFIFLDAENQIIETNEENNFYSQIYSNSFKIYFEDIETSDTVKEVYRKYLYENLNNQKFVSKRENANVQIRILKTKKSSYSLNLPYEGEVVSKVDNNIRLIQIKGEDISGQISALKYFILNKDLFLSSDMTYKINSTNFDAIKVYDFLNSAENLIYYKTNTNKFSNIVYDALNNNFLDFIEGRVQINYENGSINYRIWKYNPKFTTLLQEYNNNNSYPIILGGGLWSNILSWEEFGKKIGNSGEKVYLIELTGGENSECDSCYNYPYEFLTDEVYPSYINYVLNDSNSDKVQYIGHSNGARVAIDSISKDMIDENKFESLVAVGVPGAFEGEYAFKSLIKKYGDSVDYKNNTHLSILDLILFGKLDLEFSQSKISKSLWLEYFNWIISKNDSQPGENLLVDNFLIIGGKKFSFSDDDLIVTLKDINSIFDNVEINSKKYFFIVNSLHTGMTKDSKIQKLILKFIKKEEYNLADKLNLEKNEVK